LKSMGTKGSTSDSWGRDDWQFLKENLLLGIGEGLRRKKGEVGEKLKEEGGTNY